MAQVKLLLQNSVGQFKVSQGCLPFVAQLFTEVIEVDFVRLQSLFDLCILSLARPISLSTRVIFYYRPKFKIIL